VSGTPGSRCLIVVALLTGCGGPTEEAPGLSAAAAPVETPGEFVWFEEVAEQAGISFRYESGFDGRYIFPEIMGGGAALFDMDGDGDLDAYLVQGGGVAVPESDRPTNLLFENLGGGTFRDVTEASGTADRGYGMGVAAGDYDNDGDIDLYVTNYGPNVLLRNDGGGKFRDVTAQAAVGHPGWGVSAAFLDYDVDGDLDLFVANYLNWSLSIEQDCYNNAGLVDYCLPTNYNAPAMDALYRNEGDGRFREVTEEVGLGAAFGNGLGVVAADFDDNGAVDLFVANDTMMNQLWLNQGDGTFVDEALLRGCALDEHGTTKAGMGVSVGDIDDDGDLDLLVVNLEGQTDSFYRNEQGFFADHTGVVGLGTTSRRFTRFGIGLVDLDNDGTLDLYQANGRVVKSPEPRIEDPFAEPNLLFRGTGGGGFTEVRPRGGTVPELVHTSRAAAFGDVDGDGGVDLLVVNRDAPAYLLRNVAQDRGSWIRFRVLDEHGRDALGARLSAKVGPRRLTKEVRAAFGYCTSNDPALHLGLGDSGQTEEIVVTWPDGTKEPFGSREGGGTVVLRRGEGSS